MVSRMCAPSQKKSATGKDERKAPNPFTSKKDSPDALFEIMDKEGRGKGSYQFWYTKTYEEKMGYCRWLIEKKKVGSRTDFARKAPGFIANYFMNRALWDELGILDKRDGNKANCRQKNDSPDAPFEMMDRKGRGRGNYEFWEGKARTERIDYCKWLIKKEGIKSRTEFSKKAPCFISNYIRNNLLWDEIGLLDRRIGNPRLNGPKKRPAEAPKRHVPEAPKPERGAKRIHRRNPLLAEKLGIREGEASAIDPYSPLASLPPARSPFCPIRMLPPLPEPKFRYWQSASKDEREKMIGEFFEATRKGEIYNLEKLLSMKIPVDVRNSRGETALMEAAFWTHTKTCQILLESGADPRAIDKNGENALDYAKEGERPDTIGLIRKAMKKRKR